MTSARRSVVQCVVCALCATAVACSSSSSVGLSADSGAVSKAPSTDAGLGGGNTITVPNSGGADAMTGALPDASTFAPPPTNDGSVTPMDATPPTTEASVPPPTDASKPDTSTPTDAGVGVSAPTTCAEADEGIGCCAGSTNYFCNNDGVSVGMTPCATGTVCGWSATDDDYECVPPPATSDPSGTSPLACGAGTPLTDGGTITTDAGTGIPTTCTAADDTVGCCGSDGKNYYCAAGSTTVKSKACSSGEVCSWSSLKSYYECVAGTTSEADPSGTYPLACE